MLGNINGLHIHRLTKRFQIKTPVAVVLLLGALGAQASDFDFLSAASAAKNHDIATLQSLQNSMQGDLLEAYPYYFELNTNLESQPWVNIKNFALRYAGTALAEKLSADYVEAKVKLGQPLEAANIIGFVENPDDDEACSVAVVKKYLGDNSGLKAIKYRVWLKTDKVSEQCQMAAKEMIDSIGLQQADKLQRMWVMLSGDRLRDAQEVAHSININLDTDLLRAIGKKPYEYLVTAPLESYESQAAFIYAVEKSAEQNMALTDSILDSDKDKLPAMVYRYAKRMLTQARMKNNVAQGYDEHVVDLFEQSVGAPFSDDEADQFARHAIRFGRWEAVLKALDNMSPEKQKERLWKYWFARASEQRGDAKAKEISQQFYKSLAAENDYYGLLAKDHLGIKLEKLPADYVPTRDEVKRVDDDAFFNRAFKLREIGADAGYSNREWNWAVRHAMQKKDEGLLIAAALKANNMGWYDRAIQATEKAKLKSNYTVQYPTPYFDTVEQYTRQFNVDPAWAYGLTRQESRFITSAKSNVGAGGLMQVMPSTAKWIANRLGESYSPAKLSDMDANVRFGTFYLSHITSQLSNNAVLATAGYNAGPLRAKRWQPDVAPLDADRYVESIPFLETRGYVKNVMTNAVFYALRFNQGAQSIGQRMGSIPVRGSEQIVGP